jgi:AbrB family looped-hinge helix DNA binding protein
VVERLVHTEEVAGSNPVSPTQLPQSAGPTPIRYNSLPRVYNGIVASDRVMTLSRNGQVSIPAETRARWNTRKVIVVDLGDRVVLRPAAAAPVTELQGRYRGPGPSADSIRRQERRQARVR